MPDWYTIGVMQIRKVIPDDSLEWARMRYTLWPDALQVHLEEIQSFFAGESIDIVETFVLDRGQGGLGGFIEINIRNFAEGSRNARVPYIEAWFVDADLRAHGYGRLLIETAESWARQQGFDELASDAELENPAGIAAHMAMGFSEVERVVCFLKKLT